MIFDPDYLKLSILGVFGIISFFAWLWARKKDREDENRPPHPLFASLNELKNDLEIIKEQQITSLTDSEGKK